MQQTWCAHFSKKIIFNIEVCISAFLVVVGGKFLLLKQNLVEKLFIWQPKMVTWQKKRVTWQKKHVTFFHFTTSRRKSIFDNVGFSSQCLQTMCLWHQNISYQHFRALWAQKRFLALLRQHLFQTDRHEALCIKYRYIYRRVFVMQSLQVWGCEKQSKIQENYHSDKLEQ